MHAFINEVNGQIPFYINYDTKNGLPSNEVYDVEIDESGLIWFTTDRGVCTFDGYIFRTYTTKTGLADNTNFEIFKDSKQRLWFNGYNGKLSYYENNQFHHYLHNDFLKAKNLSWVANVIESKKGDFFFTTSRTKDLSLFSFSLNSPPLKIHESTLLNDFETIKNQDGLLVTFDNNGFYFTKSNYSNLAPFLASKIDSFFLHFTEKTVYKTNPNSKYAQQYSVDDGIIQSTFVSSEKDIWVCSTNGVYRFINGHLNSEPIHYFKNFMITNMIEDYEGNYWMTTLNNGILFIPSFKIKILELPHQASKRNRVLSIGNLENHIVFGTADSRLISYNLLEQEKKEFHLKEILQIEYLTKNDNELQTWNLKIKENEKNIILKKTKVSSHNHSKKLRNNSYLSFGGAGFKVTGNEIEPKSSSLLKKPFFEKIMSVEQECNNDIWMGTTHGLYKVENSNFEKITKIHHSQTDTFGRVNKLHIDKFENKWIATIGNGLFYHTPTQTFKLTKSDGLSSNLINYVITSNDSTVWVGTNNGLNVFRYNFVNDSLSISSIRKLSTVDGLPSNFINSIRYWKKYIWLATNNGISYFEEDIIDKTTTKPVPIHINELSTSESKYSTMDSIVLQYYENDIFINYTGISFKKTVDRLFYRYRLNLSTATTTWFYTNEKNIRYNNLKAGKYSFEVAAQNKSGLWSSPAVITFEIKPHFTKTLWFQLLCLLLIVGFTILLFLYQLKRIEKKELKKHQLQSFSLRVREAELLALRNQMNPHFVFNSLNSIQNFIFQRDIRKANYYIAKFSSLIRKSLWYTRLDIIDLEEEIKFLKEYLELESMRFPDKFISEFIIEDDLDVYELMVPSLLFQPILENIVKHAFKNLKTKGIITFRVSKKNETHFNIYIQDNGPGILLSPKLNDHLNHKSIGIEIIKNRIKLLNERKIGLQASVSFKNMSELNPKETGLQVHFILPIVYSE